VWHRNIFCVLLWLWSAGAIARERFGQDFQRHLAAQARIARAVHFAHAAGANQRDDLVRSNCRASREGHQVSALYRLARPAIPNYLRAPRELTHAKLRAVPIFLSWVYRVTIYK
jgi:hypothetical protein